MFEWLSANIGSIAVMAVVAVLVLLTVLTMVKDRKNGIGICGQKCSKCHGVCHAKAVETSTNVIDSNASCSGNCSSCSACIYGKKE